MTQGVLDKPVYQLPMPLEGIEDAVQSDEKLSSESALAALSALRFKVKDGEKEIEAVPRWMELYKRLVEGGWKWRVALYIAWAVQPKKYRWPETQELLATTCLGLTSDRAIATWRKRNPTIDETITVMQGSIVFDAIPDAFDAMVEVASERNYKGHADRELLFEMTGKYTRSSRITAEMVRKLGKGNMDASDLPDADLRDIVAAAGSELERRSKTDEETPEA